MKKTITLWFAMIMAVLLSFSAFAAETEAEASGNDATFAEWNEGAPALQKLIEYVDAVTDENGEDYIPPVDRIAVFDMDGTVYGELFPTYLEYYMLAWRILKDPTLEPDAAMLEVGREIREYGVQNVFREDMPIAHAQQAARAYAGMTLDEFEAFVKDILSRDVDGFEGMTYGEAFYKPINEVVDYLVANDFKVYVVSGSDRFICRALIDGKMNVTPEHIIGMDVGLEATGQHGEDGLNYVYTADDEVIRTDKLLIKNLKMNKVCQIAKEIGRQPVLSFGNSSGDVSMHMYTISHNKYRSEAFMLVADDDVRDYGKPEKAAALAQTWEESGFNVISMKNDFRTIYGDDVVKTGEFHWSEELKDDRHEAVNTSAESTAAPSQKADGEVQYVMYLGTNGKDSGVPVLEPEEAKEVAGDILIKHLGGYTIQEAEGGWIDDAGEKCQEYTLVIYMSDTTIDQVHEVADELIQTFDQNSVLIQTNPTTSEFYGG